MPRPRTLAAALGAALVLPALATLPSEAAVGTQALSLTDCEMVLDPFFTNQRISDNGTWSTTVTLDHPSPVPVVSGQTANLTLGAIPTGDLPEPLENVDVSVFVLVEDGRGFEFTLTPRSTTVPLVTPGTPIDLGEQDVDDLTYADSDRYGLAVKDITVGFFGDAPDGRTYYEYSCDQVVRGAPLVSVGVFDPAAAAQVFLDAFQVTQGESVRFRGEDFPNTVGPVTPTVGGQPANALSVDDIGFFDGQLVVPEFAPPGQQEVRVTYLGETATTLVTVIAKKAQLGVATKAVKAGKALGVTGSLFKPGEKVTLKLKKKGPAKKGTKKAYGSSVTAGPDGSISKAVKLKKAAKGSWKITAKGASSGRTAGSAFKVT